MDDQGQQNLQVLITYERTLGWIGDSLEYCVLPTEQTQVDEETFMHLDEITFDFIQVTLG